MSKVVAIGLNGINLSVLISLMDELPHFKKIINSGVYGKIQNTLPSTISIWASIITGLDPGQVGVYGDQQRKTHSHYDAYPINNDYVTDPPVWDLLGKRGYQSVIIDVPLCCPFEGSEGVLFVCSDNVTTYPEDVRNELFKDSRENAFHHTDLERLYESSKRRFSIARYLLAKKEWDFFMVIDSSMFHAQSLSWGSDTSYWYKLLDQELGLILELIPRNTRIIIISGYGSKVVEGTFYLNEWLYQEGYLKLNEIPKKPTPFSSDLVDWKKTYAWGMGGAYGSVFFNVKRREPQGILSTEKMEYIKNRIVHKIISLTDQTGVPLYTKVFKPTTLFSKTKSVSPDLLLNVRDCSWRLSSCIGTGKIHSDQTRLDEKTMIDSEGSLLSGIHLNTQPGRTIENIASVDITPTILHEFGITPSTEMTGKISW